MAWYLFGGLLLLYVVLFPGWWAWDRLTLWVALRRQHAKWSAIAVPLGFRVERRGRCVTILGTVAGRPFELDYTNFITYGLDAQLGLRVPVEDSGARLSIVSGKKVATPSPFATNVLPVATSVGDPAIDGGAFRVHANPAGQRLFSRLGAAERQLLLEYPEMSIHWGESTPWVELGYVELTAARLMAAHRLMADLLAAAPEPVAPTA